VGDDTFQSLQQPRRAASGHAPGLRFGDLRVLALLHALLLFAWLPAGFRNRDLREKLAPLRGLGKDDLSQGMMTYDLRRLRLHGLIESIPHSHRYRLTDSGLRLALFYTRVYARILRPGLALSAPLPDSQPSPLRKAFAACDKTIARFCDDQIRAA
jgi:DNA-binding transcriptional ArsR family regulator